MVRTGEISMLKPVVEFDEKTLTWHARGWGQAENQRERQTVASGENVK